MVTVITVYVLGCIIACGAMAGCAETAEKTVANYFITGVLSWFSIGVLFGAFYREVTRAIEQPKKESPIGFNSTSEK